MNSSPKPLEISKSNPFYNKWDSIIENAAKAFRLSSIETEYFRHSKIPHLIEAIPLIAEYDDPERAVCSHLATCLFDIKTDNPAASGAPNYESVKAKLIKKINSVKSTFMDQITEVDIEVKGVWA